MVLLDVGIDADLTIEELKEIGNMIIERATQIVPVRTGALRDSISMIVDETNKTVIVGSDLNYSTYVELGTSKMTARPYLIPSLLEALREFQTRFPEKIRSIIEK